MYERPGRPHLCPRYNALELIAEFLALAGVLLNAFIIANRWTLLPDIVPGTGIHKLWLLALGSALPVGLYIVLTMLSGRLDRFIYPVVVNPENSAVQYRLARDLLLSLKLELVWASNLILWYVTGPGNLANVLPATEVVALLLAAAAVTVAYYVWQMKRHA